MLNFGLKRTFVNSIFNCPQLTYLLIHPRAIITISNCFQLEKVNKCTLGLYMNITHCKLTYRKQAWFTITDIITNLRIHMCNKQI